MKTSVRISATRVIATGSTLLVSIGQLHAQELAEIEEFAETARTAPLEAPIPSSPEVRTGTFSNGLRYFIRENREPANRAELRLVVNAGSVLEDDDQIGLAHLLEHMAFNGTKNFEKQELVAFMESIGMRLGPGINASTSFDETVYMLRVPTDNFENVETAFQIIEDWTHGLTLDPAEVDQERLVVIEEWRGGQGASSRVRDQQIPIMFRGSKYADRLPIGTPESIEDFDVASLERFYRDWYRPELMAVIAVGDFDADAIEALMRDHFEPLENPEDARSRETYIVPDHDGTLFSVVSDPELTSTTVALIHKTELDQDWTVAGARRRIVEQLYNGMLNQRLQELTREANPPFLIGASGIGRLIRTSGLYQLQALVPEGGIERGLEVLLQESERIARFGFTDSEFERAKISMLRSFEAQYINRANRPSGLFASQFISSFLSGSPFAGVEYDYALHQRFVPEISLAEVNRVGQEWLSETNRVVLVTGPEKDGLVYPDERALQAVLSNAADADIEAYVDTVGDAELLAEPPDGAEIVATRTREGGITEWDLANGVSVVLRPTDFDDDQVIFRAFSPGGMSLADDESLVAARTALRVLGPGGLGDFTATDLQKVLAGKRATVNASIGEFEEGLSGTASPQDLKTLFELIYLRFTAPRADDNAFQVFNTQAELILGNRDQSPQTPFNDAFTRIMTRDHPRRRPETLEMIRAGADLNASLAFYQDRFADASDFTFLFVGTFEPDEIRPYVETYLGALPGIDREETWRDLGIRPPTGVHEEIVYAGLEPSSQTRIAFTGPFAAENSGERTRFSAMGQLLQTRLRNVLREELGGTYGVSVGPGVEWRPEGQYTLQISFGSDPERSEELVDRVFGEIELLAAEGPTESELADTVEAMLRSHETGLEQNAFWIGQLTAAYQQGIEPGADILLRRPDEIRALTAPDIREAIVQYLNTENFVRVTLLPNQ